VVRGRVTVTCWTGRCVRQAAAACQGVSWLELACLGSLTAAGSAMLDDWGSCHAQLWCAGQWGQI
jgi:hypothetical protein